MASLMNMQDKARALFQKQGLPNQRQEGWQWSDFSHLPQSDEAILALKPSLARIDALNQADLRLDDARDLISKDSLTLLNSATIEQVQHIAIPAGQKAVKPIVVEHQKGCGRVHIRIGANAQIELYEFVNIDGDAPFWGDRWANHCVQIDIAKNATLHHMRFFDPPDNAVIYSHHQVALAKDASYQLDCVGLGSTRQRLDHHITFLEEGGRASFRGALFGTDQRHSDIGVEMRHLAPHCASDAQLRAVLRDRAHIAFRPSGQVEAGATGSELHQMTKAIIFNHLARMNAKPELAIEHDQVQCTHGVAIGALDKEALFYLLARGMDEARARQILLQGFMGALFDEASPAFKRAQTMLEAL